MSCNLKKQEVWLGDCLKLMDGIERHSIDAVLCDLPYQATARNAWDVMIPLEPLWAAYKRIVKPNGAIILTATQPFSSKLIFSNPKMFRYDWVWVKSRAVNFLNAKKQPLRKHEQVLVFYDRQCTYNPQGLIYKPRINKRSTTGTNCNESGKSNFSEYTNYPASVLTFGSEKKTTHPTQKPLDLMEYLVETYTNPGDLILDNAAGSGTTLLAARNLGRQYIGIEKDLGFYNSINERLKII